MNCRRALGILMIVALHATAAMGSDKAEGEQKLPRFASLRSDDVNMRVGPGARYGINWVYKQDGLPVQITQQFEDWRKVRDSDGTVGWVHKQMLQSKRTAVIKKSIGVLRKSPDEHASAVLRAEPGVIGKLVECQLDWCRLQVSGRKGWIQKKAIWGVTKGETF